MENASTVFIYIWILSHFFSLFHSPHAHIHTPVHFLGCECLRLTSTQCFVIRRDRRRRESIPTDWGSPIHLHPPVQVVLTDCTASLSFSFFLPSPAVLLYSSDYCNQGEERRDKEEENILQDDERVFFASHAPRCTLIYLYISREREKGRVENWFIYRSSVSVNVCCSMLLSPNSMHC